MHFLKAFLATWACLAPVGLADPSVAFTKWPTVVYTGKPTNMYWESDSKAPATITLRKGAAGNLQNVKVLATQAQGGAFTWTPDASLAEGTDYALQIDQNGVINYSGLLTIAHTPGKEPKGPAPKNGLLASDTPPHGSMKTDVGKNNHGYTSTMNGSFSRLNGTSGHGHMPVEMLTDNASFQYISTNLVLCAVAGIIYFTA